MDNINHDYINVDPLKKSYHESIIDVPEHAESIRGGNTALLCIDLQYLDAAPGYGVFAPDYASGVPPLAQEYYFTMLRETVIPNVRRLQDAFRQNGMEVLHTRIQALTMDGRDRSAGHKRLGLLARPGSKEAEFLEEIAPRGDEIIVNKTASGVFSATNMEYILRNLEISSLFVVGVYTNECVSTTVRSACDLGFYVTVIDDACTTVTAELHEFTIVTLKDRYARVLNTEQAIAEISRHMVETERSIALRESANPLHPAT
ncbi:MAG: cysteine hydrolase [Leptospiraceae bacterium]|nr:cysteine hydrolase [Leptospiraceae bacterium]MCB1315107.1 cysteine hydrolase [Leptospiraceae bacterium]